MTGLRGKIIHNLYQPSRQNHKPFIPDAYSPMNISSYCDAFAGCERSPVPFDYTIFLCVVSQNCIVCCRDTAFIFQMPPSLMSMSHCPASDKCLRDVHLPYTLCHLSCCLVFSSPRRDLVILSSLPPCICSKKFCPLVGLCPVHSQVSFASVLWVITSPANLFDHFGDRLTTVCKDDLLFPNLQ